MEEFTEHIGGRLKQARQAAGLSLEDVVHKTQLPRTVVEALEAEDFSAFTSPVYAKSFLAQYSDFLNVDASLWLDALQPGSFMPGGLLRPLVEAPETSHVEKAPKGETRGGWLAVLGLLALTASVVFGAVKLFELFEKRFADETPVRQEVATQAAPPPPVVVDRRVPSKKPVIEKEDEELAQPPPRAIIVR